MNIEDYIDRDLDEAEFNDAFDMSVCFAKACRPIYYYERFKIRQDPLILEKEVEKALEEALEKFDFRTSQIKQLKYLTKRRIWEYEIEFKKKLRDEDRKRKEKWLNRDVEPKLTEAV